MPFPPAQRVASFGTTIFSEMSRLAMEHGAVNLGQGFPDFDGPEAVKEAAIAAIRAGHNQYAVGIGQPDLRRAIAAHADRFYGQSFDPEIEITVTSGATEALFAAIMGLVNPGDEVILLEPYYDSYPACVLMAGGLPRYVPLRPPPSPALPPQQGKGASSPPSPPVAGGEGGRGDEAGWAFDPAELAAAFGPRTRVIMLNTPHNPTGRVFGENELRVIAELCHKWNVVAVSDEVYEHLIFDGLRHVRLATLPGMRERTVTIGSLGKTFSFTGWKIGWSLAPPDLTAAVRRAHQWITFATSTPMQAAAAAALGLDDEFYQSLIASYQSKRDFLVSVLREAGLRVAVPQGTYFVMADFAPLGFDGDDAEFARWLIREIGVVVIPPSVFFSDAHKPLARNWVRFAFCKKQDTLEMAAHKLRRLTADNRRR
jgi:N-succinyldiaminopimelate aminotransferase